MNWKGRGSKGKDCRRRRDRRAASKSVCREKNARRRRRALCRDRATGAHTRGDPASPMAAEGSEVSVTRGTHRRIRRDQVCEVTQYVNWAIGASNDRDLCTLATLSRDICEIILRAEGTRPVVAQLVDVPPTDILLLRRESGSIITNIILWYISRTLLEI